MECAFTLAFVVCLIILIIGIRIAYSGQKEKQSAKPHTSSVVNSHIIQPPVILENKPQETLVVAAPRLCKFCRQPLNEGAIVCHHCTRDQSAETPQEKAVSDVKAFGIGCAILIILFLVISGVTSINSFINRQNALARCIQLNADQMEFINYLVQYQQSPNYVESGWAVKSNEFERDVYFVSAYVYGPGIENGAGPMTFYLPELPTDTSGACYSANYSANLYSGVHRLYDTHSDVSEDSDGAEESRICAEQYK